MAEAWNGFKGRVWKEEVNVRDFIQNNYTPYDGDEKFLKGPTEATNKLFNKLQELQKAEHNKKCDKIYIHRAHYFMLDRFVIHADFLDTLRIDI